ncbi:MAG: 3-isopropylmalate/(R)-2-methylmalate dehydratase large subunit [Gammaproteobacteria bacterium]|jgi:3-isopropylmalate/(R)-2-methylmalate dehydratase large subunit
MAIDGTLFDKIWRSHVVRALDDDTFLLHIDRHMLQETTCGKAFAGLDGAGRVTRNPQLTYAVIDHIVSTQDGRDGDTFEGGREFVHALRRNCATHNIEFFDVDDPKQGIVHVIAPELGIALPGTTLVCGDSHTATSGALGCYACGIGTSEVEHVLATQTLVQRKPMRMRINFHGELGVGVAAKDLVLYLIGQIGIAAGRGYVVEYAGETIRNMPMEGRLTVCNMSIELGARAGLIAPDETTFTYLKGLAYAPQGASWDEALAHWRTLASDADAVYDKELDVDCSTIEPQVTWGTTVQDVSTVHAQVPDPATIDDDARRQSVQRSLDYIDLKPGQRLAGVPIDVAFIGSCTNGRLSDLQAAAAIARGRHVAPKVRALVVPGSAHVRKAAEALGLDQIFKDAGFEWREAGCSMCVAINDDQVAPGQRCISTSNRNFENRQGPRSRTHLASPASVAAAAVAGVITDHRTLSQ